MWNVSNGATTSSCFFVFGLVSAPLLAFNLGGHLGIERRVTEGGGQRAERGGHHQGLGGVALGLVLVDVEDLPALGVALGGRDQPPQPGREHRRGRPVGGATVHHRDLRVWEEEPQNESDVYINVKRV